MIQKHRKGFSLIEMMVVAGIISVLLSIGIPVQMKYLRAARSTALKADMSSIHKGWQAFGSLARNYCYNEKSDVGANLESVGLMSLFSGKRYGSDSKKKPNFIGFGSIPYANLCKAGTNNNSRGNGEVVLNKAEHETKVTADSGAGIGIGVNSSGGTADQDTNCDLGIATYEIGAFAFVGKNIWEGMSLNERGVLSEVEEETSPTAVGNHTPCSS